MARTVSSILVLLLLVLPAGCGDDGVRRDEAVAEMNRGLAKLEQFEYVAAADHFEKAVELDPGWEAAKLNLAVAWLNARGEHHRQALDLLAGILADDPANPRANFMTGVILRVGAEAERAIPYFDRVLEADPGDAASWYWKGMCLIDLERKEEADQAFREAIRADPYLAAAYHQRHGTLIRMRRPEEAKEALDLSRRLKDPPEGEQFPIAGDLLTAKAYHEIGKYALAVRDYGGAVPDGSPGVERRRAGTGDLAGYRYGGDGGAELTEEPRREGESDREYVLRVASRIGPGVVVGDVDDDGDADVYLPEWGGAGRLYRNEGGLRLADATADSGIVTACMGVAGAFFDADADGDLDLYVTAAGPNVYYENEGGGRFVDRTEEAGLAGGDVVSLSVLPTDFDQEGDIDLFVLNWCRLDDASLAGAPDALFRNNRDGTFVDVAERRKVSGGDARSIGALELDIDRDLDPDYLVIRDRGPAALWRNERIWAFRSGELPGTLTGTEPAWGAAAGDLDRDGAEEVIVFRGPGAVADSFSVAEGGRLVPRRCPFGDLRWRTGILTDLDLDGALDVAGDGVVLLDGTGSAGPVLDEEGDFRGMGFADLDGDGDLDAVAAGNDAAAILETVAPSENHWLAVDLAGREALQPAAWAAKTGPGHELEVRAGRLWQPMRSRVATGFLSTVEGPVRFGLGRREKADIVRILWSDRVLQVEAEILADQVKRIEELNRKPSSCPMLFGFDGERQRYVTDFLGVGGLGFFLAPGVYGESDPDEYVRIGEWLRPDERGDLVLQVLEPLEEISYLDELTLVAVDHPAGMEVFPNERYVGEKALFPEDRIYGVREKVFPVRATDLGGDDILSRLARVDRVYAPVTPDHRFPGVAEEHAVVLDFTGRVPALGKGERLVLFLDGWIEYGYSKTFYAAWQARVPSLPPRLEVPDGRGGWRVLVENTGCPAGMPKGSTLDVTGIVTPARPVFRIRTNYEIFWDRIFLGVDAAPGRIRVTRLSPGTAHLHDRGYPREYSPDGRQPILYDYGLMDPGYPFRHMSGEYTRFGEVTPLVTETDDRYVIMGHGEEVTLRFPVGALPELAAGMRRTFLLYAAGWCKDMDAYTARGDTVGPLPFRGMTSYPYAEGESYPDDPAHRRWRAEWNTRRKP